MKLLIIILFFFIVSCQNHSNKIEPTASNAPPINKIDTSEKNQVKDLSETPSTDLYLWAVNFYEKTKMRNQLLTKEYLNTDSLIKGLNILYPKIKLDKIKLSNDTLFTEIKNSEYLGEQIGSDGANSYIAFVVINLTSIKNINFIKIDFEDGSHISQGVWSKNEFNNYREVR